MGLEQILVISMFATFMGLLLLGFPVAWSLAGIGLLSLPALGAVAPIGGLLMVAAWLLLLVSALGNRARPT